MSADTKVLPELPINSFNYPFFEELPDEQYKEEDAKLYDYGVLIKSVNGMLDLMRHCKPISYSCLKGYLDKFLQTGNARVAHRLNKVLRYMYHNIDVHVSDKEHIEMLSGQIAELLIDSSEHERSLILAQRILEQKDKYILYLQQYINAQ